MIFLLIEFFVTAILANILNWIIAPEAAFVWGRRPPMGHELIPIYLWISVRLFQYCIRKETPDRKRKFTIAYTYKLALTFLMSYLLVTRYNFGDYQTYYSFSYWVADYLRRFDWEAIREVEVISNYFFRGKGELNSTTIVSYTFSALFVILPPSLYGLSLLSGTIIFIATYKLYLLLEPHIHYRRLFFLIYFFSPSITMQLGYTGKETLILPLITAFIIVAQKKSRTLAGALLLFPIFYIRFYQAFFLILSWIGARLTLRQIFSLRGTPILAVGGAGIAFILKKVTDLLGGIGPDLFTNLSFFLSTTYSSGNLVLPPLPFPFTYVQPFRPFPWESHNALAMATAMEMFLLLLLACWLIVSRFRILRERFHHDKLFRFLTIYVTVQFFIFSYIDNMGDLVRRKIYFVPLLFALVMVQRMPIQDVAVSLAARAGKLKPRRRSPEAHAGSAPPSPPA